MSVKLSACGPFAALVKQYADTRGVIPLPGDRKQDFVYADGTGRRDTMTWREWCDCCASQLRHVEKQFAALQETITAVEERPQRFFRLSFDVQQDLMQVLSKEQLIRLLSRSCKLLRKKKP